MIPREQIEALLRELSPSVSIGKVLPKAKDGIRDNSLFVDISTSPPRLFVWNANRWQQVGLESGDFQLGSIDPIAITGSSTNATISLKYNSSHFSIVNGELTLDTTLTTNPTFDSIRILNLSSGYVPYHISDQTGLGDSPIFVNNNNIGIGTTNPSYKLDINGTGRFTGALQLDTQATATNHAVAAGRTIQISTTAPLTGGGSAVDLTADRSWTLGITTANLLGTTNQVNVANGTGVIVGSTNVTLSLPQDIATTSTPTFAQVSLGNQASTTSHSVRADRIITANAPLTGGGNLTADRTLGLSYNNTNLKLTNNALNTIQDIATTSSPTFDQVYLSSKATDAFHSVRADRIIDTAAPLTGGGDLTEDKTFSLAFNTTNLKLTNNALNTIQDIATTSTPIFSNIILNGLSSGYIPYKTLSTLSNSIIYTDGSNIGIGTVNPAYNLDVNGTFRASTSILSSLLNIDNLRLDGNTISSTNTNGNIVLSPNGTGLLEVTNTTSGNVKTAIFGRGADTNFQISIFQDKTSNNTGALVGGIGLNYSSTNNSYIRFHRGGSTIGGFMSFTTNDDSERMRITSTGNIGINTINPIYKLDVNGTGRFTGSLQLDTQATATNHAVAGGRIINTDAPLTGGGNLTADRTLGLSYNTTNLKITSNALNTIQDIATTSSPTFANINITNNITGKRLYFNSTTNGTYLSTDASGNLRLFSNNSRASFDAPEGYHWVRGVWGQPKLVISELIDVLFRAPDRFSVTPHIPEVFDGSVEWSGFTIPANTAQTITIDLTAKGTVGSDGIIYASGYFYLSFNWIKIPASVTGRVKNKDGVWTDITEWINISTNPSYAVWRGKCPIGNWITEIEFTITAQSGIETRLTQIEYFLTKPIPEIEYPYFSKYTDNNSHTNLIFRDSNNSITAQLTASSGSAYFLGSVGVGTNITSFNLDVNGTGRFAQDLRLDTILNQQGTTGTNIFKADINQQGDKSIYNNFTSGWTGSGWRVDYGITAPSRSHLELDDLTVRGTMRVYELIINQIRATNGSLFVSSSAKAESVERQIGDPVTYTIIFEDPEGHGVCPFLVGDIVLVQRVRLDSITVVKQIVLQVTSVTGTQITGSVISENGQIAKGDLVVRIGNTTNTNRQGSLYLTSDDANAPYMDVVDGVNSWSAWISTDKIKVRLGKLTGINDSFFGTLSGYGLYAKANAYLRGTLYVQEGSWVAGWTTDANSFSSPLIITNDKQYQVKLVADNTTGNIGLNVNIDINGELPSYLSVGRIRDGFGNIENSYGIAYKQEYDSYFELSDTIKQIAGWNFDTQKFYKETDIELNSQAKSVGVNSNKVKLFYTDNNNWGLLGQDSAGNTIFQLGSTNQIAGWSFNTNSLSSPIINSDHQIQLRADSSTGVIGAYLDINTNDANPLYISLGKIKTAESSYSNNYGLSAKDEQGNDYFELSNNRKHIAGWDFDTQKFYKGTDIELNATNKSIGVNSNKVKLFYTDNNNWGLLGQDSAGNTIFQLGSTNQIAGWSFNTNSLSSPIINSDHQIQLRADSSTGVIGAYLDINTNDANPLYISLGKIKTAESSYSNNYGLSAKDEQGNDYFELSNNRKHIAGWDFNETKLYKSIVSLEASTSMKGLVIDNDKVRIGEFTSTTPTNNYQDNTVTFLNYNGIAAGDSAWGLDNQDTIIVSAGSYNHIDFTVSDNRLYHFVEDDDVPDLRHNDLYEVQYQSMHNLYGAINKLVGRKTKIEFKLRAYKNTGGDPAYHNLYVNVFLLYFDSGWSRLRYYPLFSSFFNEANITQGNYGEIDKTGSNAIEFYTPHTLNTNNIYIVFRAGFNENQARAAMDFEVTDLKFYSKLGAKIAINQDGFEVYNSDENYIRFRENSLDINSANIKLNGRVPMVFLGKFPNAPDFANIGDIYYNTGNSTLYMCYDASGGNLQWQAI